MRTSEFIIHSGSLWVILVLVTILALVSLDAGDALGEGFSVFTLENRRNVDTVVFDLDSARSEQLSAPEHMVNSSLISADVDGDGQPEIYYCSIDGDLVQYRTKDDKYTILAGGEGSHYTSAPQVVDIDSDGAMECLIYDHGSNTLRCIDPSTKKEEWHVENDLENPFPDGNIDPQFKVFMDPGTKGLRILVSMCPGELLILDGAGGEVWRHDIASADETRNYLLPMLGVADIDLDGTLDGVAISSKRIDGKMYVGIDLFSLDPPTWKRGWTVPFDQYKSNRVLTPPLIWDIDQNEDGLEVVFGTTYGGIWAVSSIADRILWRYEVDVDEAWMSIGTVATRNGTRIVASSRERVLVLDATTGHEVCTHPMGVNRLPDLPQKGYFELNDPQQGLLHASGRSIKVVDPETRRIIWNQLYEERTQSIRHILVTDREGVAVELHVFFWYDGGNKGAHYRYWSPEDEDHGISVAPERWIIPPNASQAFTGVKVTGSTVSIERVFWRLYMGNDVDLVAISTFPVDGQGTPFTHPHEVQLSVTEVSTGDSIVMEGILQASWYFVAFGDLNVQLTVYSDDGSSRSLDVEGWMVWESDLEVRGQLGVEDSEGKYIPDGGWSRGDINATLQGLQVVYPDGAGMQNGSGLVSAMTVDGVPVPVLIDDQGNVTGRFHIPGRAGDLHITLELSCQWSPFKFSGSYVIHLDQDPPEFSTFFPEMGTWFGDSDVTVGCTLTDGVGSGIGRLSVQYWAEEGSPTDWLEVTYIVQTSSGAEGQRVLELTEGTWYYRWRAFDMVGNGPVTSPDLDLAVDLTGVVFDDFDPTDWSADRHVAVSVKVTDMGGSGVDLSSIEYSSSVEGLAGFSPWVTMGLAGASPDVTVDHDLALEEGMENFVRFRAADVAGNSRNSSAYRLRVDLTLPTFSEPYPSPDLVIDNASSIECNVGVTDHLSGVDPDTVGFQYTIGEDGFSEWLRPVSVEGSDIYIAEVLRNPHGPTGIRWRARDQVNEAFGLSDLFVVHLNQPPEITAMTPTSPLVVTEGTKVLFSVNVSDPEGDPIDIKWIIDGVVVSENSTFERVFPTGIHTVDLSLDDGHGNAYIVPTTIQVNEEPDVIYGEPLMIGIIILIVIFSIVAVLRYLVRTKEG